MNIEKWLQSHTSSLQGKCIAVTGSTGGLGKELCRYLSSLHASLILLDRHKQRSLAHAAALMQENPSLRVTCIPLDLEDLASAERAVQTLIEHGVDVFIHNAGAYSIPRHTCESGYDNVFQINFATPYYMIRRLMPYLRSRQGKVVVVGSIAHRYGHIDIHDIDYATRSSAAKVYGNAKRFLMFSLYELFKDEREVTLSVTHPGITFTNITAHYPKVIFTIIKHPMKIIFMKPRKAALSVLKGVFDTTEHSRWIGPSLFDVWGYPQKKKLRFCSENEVAEIARLSEEVFEQCQKSIKNKGETA